MTYPSGGGSAPLGADPTAAYPTAGGPGGQALPPHPPVVQTGPPLVPVAASAAPTVARDVRPVAAAAPVAAAGAVPLTPRDRDGRDGDDRRRRKAPLAWLPWALLAALLGLLALMLLAGTLAGADKATRGAASGGAAAGGTLTSGGVDVLADRQSLGRLGALQGQEAVGRGVTVQSVVADEGFWVGPSAAQRTFVFLTPEARRSSGESGFQVRQGQEVDLDGVVTGTSEGDPQRFGVTDTEGARQLLAQRAYVRASQVRLTQQ